MNKIYFVDSIMGSGKSTALIHMMNNCPSLDKILYMTPFLDEADRINAACTRDFVIPSAYVSESGSKITKGQDLTMAIDAGKSVSSSHSMLRNLLLTKLDLSEYSLVLDESMDLVSIYSEVTKNDCKWLLDKEFISVDAETSRISATDTLDLPPDRYRAFITLLGKECLFLSKQGIVILDLPTSLLEQCKRVVIMSYLVEGSYLYHSVSAAFGKPTKLTVNGSMTGFKRYNKLEAINQAKDAYKLINTFVPSSGENDEYEKINKACKLTYSATKSISKATKSKVCNLMYHTLQSKMCAAQGKTLVSSFSDTLQIKGFKKSFVPYNCRATNNHQHTNVLAYLIQKHDNPIITQWQKDSHDLVVSDDMYSLDCMLQWIFRSAIRNGKPVKLFLPSPKMRKLLEQWGSGGLF